MGIEQVKFKAIPVLQRHRVKRAAVFGSVARGEERPDSDVDLLVEVSRPFGLAQLVALKRGLEAALCKPVDVVEYDAIKPAFAKSILKDAQIIYG